MGGKNGEKEGGGREVETKSRGICSSIDLLSRAIGPVRQCVTTFRDRR